MASSSSLTGKKVATAPLSRDQLIDFIQSSISNQGEQDRDQEMEPFYVLDLGAVNSLVESWVCHLPMVRPFYAVKCNPNLDFLKAMAALGTGFDCASRAEIQTILALGVSPDRIVFANTCKPESHLKYAAEVGVNLTTFDSMNELEKIRKWHPKSALLIRIKVPESSGAATFQFGSKFGALPEEIVPLLEAARANQLEIVGVSFHIGSRAAIDFHAFEEAIAAAKTTFEAAAQLGLPKLRILNIGGGYTSGPKFPEVASAMKVSLQKYFPDEAADHRGLTVMAEPGQFFANTPFTLATTIIGKRVRGEVKEYWINDGIWGSLNFLKCEHDHDNVICTPLANHGGGSNENPTFKGVKTYDSTVFGPTCDPTDTVLKGYHLPELEVNDRLVFHNMGAYTTSRGNDFNGFKTSAIATYLALSVLSQTYDKARNALALALSPVVKALIDPDGAMRDIRDLDSISFSDWFLSKGGTRMSIQRMWDPVAYALGFIDCDNISARCMLTIFSLFATKTEASLLRMLKGSPDIYLSGPIRNYITERGGRLHLRWGCREILYNKSADGETYVTGLAMSKATNKKLITADAYVAACDVPGIKRLLPSQWRELEFFNNIYELVGVPVVTVQLRYNGWVTELQDLERSRQLRQALGLDNLLYTPDADFSCFADLALTSPEDYYIEGQGSLLQCVLTPGDPYMPLPNDEIIKRVAKQVLALFPSSQGLEVIWSSVVKIGQSLYREGPGKDPFRPDQKTPLKNFFLAGSYTKQDYIDSMEGATLSGRQASAYICDAGEELVALRKKLAAIGSQDQTETSSVPDELSLV